MQALAARPPRWFAALLFTFGLAVTAASAATKVERAGAADAAVDEALRCEIRGADDQRNDSLRTVLERDPDCAPARWHSGYVQEDDRWVKFDASAKRSPEDASLAEYRRLRRESEKTVEGQLQLAGWCSTHKLPDQARAHLTEALRMDPNHAEARRRLGHRRVEGVWLSPEEIEQFRAQADRVAEDLKEWVPKLKRIRYGLAQRDDRKRQEAIDGLLAIRDPAAIGAMELVLAGSHEEAALLMTQALDQMPGNEASLALARQAVFSPFNSIRYDAAKALTARKIEGYVPAMLSAMSAPVQSQAGLYVTPRGRLVYRQMFYREAQFHAEKMVFDSEYRDPILTADARAGLLEGIAQLQQRDAANRAQELETVVAGQNDTIAQINRRVCDVLAKATGEDVLPSPENWWEWWNDYNESYLPEKPVREVYNRQELPTPTPPARKECLIAGTPVWTASGLVPIEEIRVGDRVLSQNPHTGELAYKPVLRTTLRPPVRLVKVVFDGEALQSSGGHPFWVAGQGWVKARDLKPAARLHAVSGTSEVWSVHPTGFEETHNLVVADFHTYFVAKTKILSHDNTIREPTDAVVPGLASR
ncbi:MAG TPA: polymorphic toxin-type HINT domain-containing protein [Thermoguttaceae bacterium]|nr:polymorphic toxin-type HINT domain-containing protein [Thermoguttaceae bacterium]